MDNLEHYLSLLGRHAIGLEADICLVPHKYLPPGKKPKFLSLRRNTNFVSLFPHQKEIVNATLNIYKEYVHKTVLLSLPTGGGKSLAGAWTMLELLKSSEYDGVKRCICLAPRKELVDQALEAMELAWNNGSGPDSLDLRVIDKSSDLSFDDAHSIYFMTDSLAKRVSDKLVNKFSFGIIDEAHHTAAHVLKDLWRSLLNQKEIPFFGVGLSATPYRNIDSENTTLTDAFSNKLILPKSLGVNARESLIKSDILARPVYRKVPNIPSYLQRISGSANASNESLVFQPKRWSATLDCLNNKVKGQCIVFARGRAHGLLLSRALVKSGKQAVFIDGKTNSRDRIIALDLFKSGKIQFLVNVMILVEGVDCPSTASVFLTYTPDSSILINQMIGRGLRGRKTGGSSECDVWHIDGSAEYFEDCLDSASAFAKAGWHTIYSEINDK